LLDKMPTLMNYLILSGHFNRSTKVLSLAMSIVQDKYGINFVIVCFLRTKCVKPRYDALLYEVASGECFRVQGLKKFR